MKWGSTKVKRPMLKGELKDRVCETILEYVKRNPSRQVPAADIAKMYGLTPMQVTGATLHLVRMGKLERLSKYTYAIPAPRIVEFNGQPLDAPTIEITDPPKTPMPDISRKADFIVPKHIKVHDVDMILDDLDLEASPTGLGGWEARADYKAKYSFAEGSKSLTLRFTSEEQFNELLAMASGKVVE